MDYAVQFVTSTDLERMLDRIDNSLGYIDKMMILFTEN